MSHFDHEFGNARGNALTRAAAEEVENLGDFEITAKMNIHVVCCLIGNLQLAMRHPSNTGPSNVPMVELVAGLIDVLEIRGYVKTAELMRLGNDPNYDRAPGARRVATGIETVRPGSGLRCSGIALPDGTPRCGNVACSCHGGD